MDEATHRMAETDQGWFAFGDAGGSDASGLDRWHQERQRALGELALQLGLPLGHCVDLQLRDGTRLHGRLLLADDNLWIEPERDVHRLLRIDRCTFTAAEVEVCVRVD